MRVWIDLANSPHVNLFGSLVDDLKADGYDVLLTARDHAQTLELAQQRWPEVTVVGGPSPGNVISKGAVLGRRALALQRFARRASPDVALSHGSYAQIVAASLARVPSVSMMDYEHQPANHLGFRLVGRAVVPNFFPDSALQRFGAAPAKVLRYDGFKEELYLAGFEADPSVLEDLGLTTGQVIVVMRPPPEGALYHRSPNLRFDELLEQARRSENVAAVLLPRLAEQVARYRTMDGVIVPTRAIDACSLLASADLTIGAGGTMSRESALLGTPTYTVFAGRLAAADQELMRTGRLRDLRAAGSVPPFEKKATQNGGVPEERRQHIVDRVRQALLEAVG